MGLKALLKPSASAQNTLTLYLNHMLVVYSFLIPLHHPSKSSVLFVMILLFLYRMDYWKYLREVFSNKVVQAFLLFYIVWLIGFIHSEDFAFAKDSLKKANFFLLPLLFLSFLDERFSYRIISAFALGMLFSEVVSYGIQFDILPHSFYVMEYEIYTAYALYPAPFFNHLDHNIGLSIVIAFFLYQLLHKDMPGFLKAGYIFFIITATINMSYIGSRTGYVLFLALLLLVFSIRYKHNLVKAILIASFFILSASYIAYNNSDTVHQRVDLTIKSAIDIIEKEDYSSSIGLRIGATKYSLEVIKDNLFFGVGTGDYMNELRSYIPEKHNYISSGIAQPHNVYITTLLQFGIIGFSIFLFLFYSIFRYKHVDKNKKDLIIILTAAVIIFMLPGKFYGNFVLPMFVTILSALMVETKKNINYKEMNSKTLLTYFFVIMIFLIIGITK